MQQVNEQHLSALLAAELGIDIPLFLTKEQIISHLQMVVSRLLQKNPERFFQLMYRLDIPEQQLQQALDDRDEGINRIAGLIYYRQLQKIKSRQVHPEKNEADKDLEW